MSEGRRDVTVPCCPAVQRSLCGQSEHVTGCGQCSPRRWTSCAQLQGRGVLSNESRSKKELPDPRRRFRQQQNPYAGQFTEVRRRAGTAGRRRDASSLGTVSGRVTRSTLCRRIRRKLSSFGRRQCSIVTFGTYAINCDVATSLLFKT